MKSNRGSVTVIAAVIISTLVVMMSASQGVMSAFMGKELAKSLDVKTGKRANGGGLSLTATLVNSRFVNYVANLDGSFTWTANFDTATYQYKQAGTNGMPMITMPQCNPRQYNFLQPNLSGLRPVLPQQCQDNGIALVPIVNFTGISNNGVWQRGGPNYLSVTGSSTVPITRGALGLPLSDDARINTRAPRPTCSITATNNDPAFPRSIILGQTISLQLATSKNAEYSEMQRVENGAYVRFPTNGSPANLNVDQGGTAIATPTRTGTVTYRGHVTGPVDPEDSQALSSDCSVEVIVYPPPTCTTWATPPEVTVGQATTLTLITSNRNPGSTTYSPIKAATLDGSTTGNDGGTKVVYPPQGVSTYIGRVTGINNYPQQSCSTTVYSYAYPVCSLTQTAPVLYNGQYDTFYMYTNKTARYNTSGNNLQSASIGGIAVNPAANPSAVSMLMTNPYTVPIVRTTTGVVGGVNGSANSCSTNTTVLPTCPYRDPNYVGLISLGQYGVHRFSRRYNPNNLGACNWLCEDAGCRATHPGSFGEYVLENAAKSFGDFADIASGAGCFSPNAVCGNYYIIAQCSTPTAAWVIPDINDPNCQANTRMYSVRNDGDGCFAREAKVTLADGSQKAVTALVNGDALWNPARKKAMRVRELTRGPEKPAMYDIGFGDHTVRVTEGHPFPTRDGMKQAAALSKRDEIQAADGTWHRVTTIVRPPLRADEVVYNFTLETDSAAAEDHMIVADGVVTGDLFLQRRLAKQVKALGHASHFAK